MEYYVYTRADDSDDDTWEEINIDADAPIDMDTASDGSWEDLAKYPDGDDAMLDVAGNIDGGEEEEIDKKHDTVVKENEEAAVKSSEKKSSDDARVQTLIKLCPKCDAGIDEIEGCSYMRCKCKHESCREKEESIEMSDRKLKELEICARYFEEFFNYYTEREAAMERAEKGTAEFVVGGCRTAEEIGGSGADKLSAVTKKNF